MALKRKQHCAVFYPARFVESIPSNVLLVTAGQWPQVEQAPVDITLQAGQAFFLFITGNK